MLKSVAFCALFFFFRNIFNLSEKMTDNRFNVRGFPPKVVKFAERAFRASVLQQKKWKRRFVLWSVGPSHKSGFFFWSLLRTLVWMLSFPRKKMLVLLALVYLFILRDWPFPNVHRFGAPACLDLWHGHFRALHHPQIQIQIQISFSPPPPEQPLPNPPGQWKRSTKSPLN